MGGLRDLSVRESTLFGTSCHHQKRGSVGIPSVHHQEGMAGTHFSTIFRPFPCSNNVQVLGTVQSPRAVCG